jgi:uncharacterized protein YbcV (DUF1398 family)
MNKQQIIAAETCLQAAQDGTLSFPEIIARLINAGFEGYAVDYRSHRQVFYTPEGDSLALALVAGPGPVAAAFAADGIEALVRWAQSGAADYSYGAFSERARAAGCAGYLVSFPGRRVVYYGRTAEIHVEHFPG